MQLLTTRRLVIAVIVPVLVFGIAACSSDEQVGTTGTDPDPSAEEIEATEEDPTDVDDPGEFAFGQEVVVVDGDVEPRLLAADKDAPITIRNSTAAPVEVRFTNPGWDLAGTTTTGALAPGGVFELEPIGVASITYEVVGTPGVTGIIQVEEGLDEI